MIYELLVEQLALSILETRLLSEGGHRRGHGGVITVPSKRRFEPSRTSIRKLNPKTVLVYDNNGKVTRVPETEAHKYAGLAEAYLSKYSYRTPRETMRSRVTVDPKTGKELSARTHTAKIDSQADLSKLELVKGRVRETGKPHEVTFIGKKGPQLQPKKHREVEHKLEVRMHMGEPHVFFKGQRVQLRSSGNGVHLVAPGEKSDRILGHTGMLSSPHFGGAATGRGRREGRAIEQRTAEMAKKRTRVARRVAKKRRASSTIREKAAAVAGKARKLTPPPAAPQPNGNSRMADIMKRLKG